jgi:hypothetical protein
LSFSGSWKTARKISSGQYKVVKGELVDQRLGVGEIGVNLKAEKVADNQQRGIVEILAVLEQLQVGGFEILVLSLVLPAKEAALPDVGKALVIAGFVDVLLEGVIKALGVGSGRMRLVEDLAEIDEMRVRARALGQLAVFPAANKFRQAQDHGVRRVYSDGRA